MKALVLGFISFLALNLAYGASVAPCGQEVFLNKVCVSKQALPLQGDEMAQLHCEERGANPGIYSTLAQAFDRSPDWMQKRLCALKGFGVYFPDKGTALSWSYFEDGGYIGISRLRVDQAYDLSAQAATMMRQAKKTKTIPEGVVFPESFGYKAPQKDGVSGLLYLMAHEVGHIVYNDPDREWREQNFSTCSALFGTYGCYNFTPGQFAFEDWIIGTGELSDIVRGKIRPAHQSLRDFVLADASVSYTPASAEALFRTLNSSHFVSVFALYSPEEDFCETVAHVVLAASAEPLEFHYLNGETVNVWDRIKKPAEAGLKNKIDFVHRVLGN